VPLDELYLEWLYSQVADPGFQDEDLTYWEVLKVLFKTPFAYVVPMDVNRIMDGKALRRRFVSEKGLSGVSESWIKIGCSVLELMVGLSQRLSFLADGEPHYWFWELMDNLGLRQFTDAYELPYEDIEEMLDGLIFRNYEYNGRGGFFPLRNPQRDQRDIELWAQLADYIEEIES
jgi:hypothetical protein